MITKFLLNAILYHVGMSWIIRYNDEMKYKIDESNHKYFLNKGPWYNTDTCSRLHGSLFEYFITHAITDIYNLMCYLVARNGVVEFISVFGTALKFSNAIPSIETYLFTPYYYDCILLANIATNL